jgi:hypothetical protein
VYVSDTLWPV